MRHRRRVKHFSRKPTARRALIKGLVSSLVEHGRIKTTVEKAKEIRRHVERAITKGKTDDLATLRLLASRFSSVETAKGLIKDISVRMKDRPGGYTRIIKIGRRPGDTAEMAFLEFVDFDWKAKQAEVDAAKTAKPVKKAAAKKVAKEPKAPKEPKAAKKAPAKKAKKSESASAKA